MISDRTPIVDLDAYRQYPFDPSDFPVAEPEIEVVEWHPDEDPRWNNDTLVSEIAALRAQIDAIDARSRRRYDRTDLVLVAMLGILGTALAILLFGPA